MGGVVKNGAETLASLIFRGNCLVHQHQRDHETKIYTAVNMKSKQHKVYIIYCYKPLSIGFSFPIAQHLALLLL